jgi:hypothetical protein
MSFELKRFYFGEEEEVKGLYKLFRSAQNPVKCCF